MRLLRVAGVLSWDKLLVYEDITNPDHFVQQPYGLMDESLWSKAMVLSWRWGKSKPPAYTKGFSPITDEQWAELRRVLRVGKAAGIEYIWIDWCSIPQYGEGDALMLEIMRSKVLGPSDPLCSLHNSRAFLTHFVCFAPGLLRTRCSHGGVAILCVAAQGRPCEGATSEGVERSQAGIFEFGRRSFGRQHRRSGGR